MFKICSDKTKKACKISHVLVLRMILHTPFVFCLLLCKFEYFQYLLVQFKKPLWHGHKICNKIPKFHKCY